jgi:UPF0271 protein
MHFSIDLNCDMGEGMDNDALIMPFISSANIACGYHAGDEFTMQQTIELALQHNVVIGAHPSFPDKKNFGRINMNFHPDQVEEMIKIQLATLSNIAAKNNASLHHVKPHGALYNMAAKDDLLASAICKAVFATDRSLWIYGLSGSKLIEKAQSMNLNTCQEAFADRYYQIDGSLTPRSQPNALIENEGAAIEQVLQIILQKKVTTIRWDTIPMIADTICIHGDGKQAVEFTRNIHKVLCENSISITPKNETKK